jgi:propanediol dehydratase small subunit
MALSTISLVIAVTAVVLYGIVSAGHLLSPFASRRCQGKGWREAFPNAPKTEIREFLALFVDAFAFPDKDKLKFSPDDKILSIYRALYPSRWMPDALEVETLSKDIEARYGVPFASVWNENVTLGELFAITRNAWPCRAQCTRGD